MSISCEEAQDLLAAYAMDRLDGEDGEAMSEHVSSCRRHDEELAELRAIAGALVLAAEEEEPPARLRANLLAAFDEEASVTTWPRPAAPGRAPAPGLFERIWRRPAFAYGIAAALAVVALGLGVWNVSLQSRSEPAVVRVFNQGGLTMRVVYLRDEQVAVLEVNMPALQPDQTYQAWKVPEGQGAPVSLGLLSNHGTFAFSTDLDDTRAIAISVEPAGGSPQPTTTPVVLQEL
jgi:anti-sigma-K factor RskA